MKVAMHSKGKLQPIFIVSANFENGSDKTLK